MPSTTPTDIETIVDGVGGVVSSGLDWASDVGTFIIGHPLILLFVTIGLVGLGIGIVKRLINI